jgi:hypothetical protein
MRSTWVRYAKVAWQSLVFSAKHFGMMTVRGPFSDSPTGIAAPATPSFVNVDHYQRDAHSGGTRISGASSQKVTISTGERRQAVRWTPRLFRFPRRPCGSGLEHRFPIHLQPHRSFSLRVSVSDSRREPVASRTDRKLRKQSVMTRSSRPTPTPGRLVRRPSKATRWMIMDEHGQRCHGRPALVRSNRPAPASGGCQSGCQIRPSPKISADFEYVAS